MNYAWYGILSMRIWIQFIQHLHCSQLFLKPARAITQLQHQIAPLSFNHRSHLWSIPKPMKCENWSTHFGLFPAGNMKISIYGWLCSVCLPEAQPRDHITADLPSLTRECLHQNQGWPSAHLIRGSASQCLNSVAIWQQDCSIHHEFVLIVKKKVLVSRSIFSGHTN